MHSTEGYNPSPNALASWHFLRPGGPCAQGGTHSSSVRKRPQPRRVGVPQPWAARRARVCERPNDDRGVARKVANSDTPLGSPGRRTPGRKAPRERPLSQLLDGADTDASHPESAPSPSHRRRAPEHESTSAFAMTAL
eukprot:350077-Chlamydomonas_euryale.AAC.20